MNYAQFNVRDDSCFPDHSYVQASPHSSSTTPHLHCGPYLDCGTTTKGGSDTQRVNEERGRAVRAQVR